MVPLGPTWVTHPNRTSIGSADFAGPMNVSRQTRQQITLLRLYSVAIGPIASAAMRPNKNAQKQVRSFSTVKKPSTSDSPPLTGLSTHHSPRPLLPHSFRPASNPPVLQLPLLYEFFPQFCLIRCQWNQCLTGLPSSSCIAIFSVIVPSYRLVATHHIYHKLK